MDGQQSRPDYYPSFSEIGGIVSRFRRGLQVLDVSAGILHAACKQVEREIKSLEDGGSMFDGHRIAVLSGQKDLLTQEILAVRRERIEIGGYIVSAAELIDVSTSLEQRCQLFGVNVADRADLEPDAGTIDILYIHKLENSAEYRSKDFQCGVLSAAVMDFFCDQLIHNEKLKAKAHEALFGVGGMFEFLPTYSRKPDGTMVRNPPKLRAV